MSIINAHRDPSEMSDAELREREAARLRSGIKQREEFVEREIEEQADALLQDEGWLWGLFDRLPADEIRAIGSIGRKPFDMDKAKAFAEMLCETALDDARYMHKSYIPVMFRKQTD